MKFADWICCIILLFLPLFLVAQTNDRDILSLKNGSIIKGRILELIPDKIVKIKTADGNIFVFPISEVERISKETLPEKESAPVADTMKAQFHPSFGIGGGVAIPMGDFAKKEGGSAKTGFALGAQYVTGGRIGFLLSGSYVSNSLEFSSALPSNIQFEKPNNWHSMFAMAGLKIGMADPSGPQFMIAPLFGLFIGKIPELKFSLSNNVRLDMPDLNIHLRAVNLTLAQQSATRSAVAYGFAMECFLGRQICIGARYLESNPRYEVEDRVTGTGLTDTNQTVDVSEAGKGIVEQSTSLIMIYVFVLL